MIKKAKKITRRRRKKNPLRMYFGPEVHESIVKYQSSDCNSQREVIYIEEIKPAFDKLSENLIFIHGFAKNHDSYETLRSDCVSFLYETLNKFDPSRGTKAFSYFNVVAKNWLIVNCRQHNKNALKNVSVDHPDLMSNTHKELLEQKNTVPGTDEIIALRQRKQEILRLLEDMSVKISNENELIVLEAVRTLFRSIDDLDLLNKRAVLLYIREISGLDKKQLAKSLGSIRRHYRKMAGPDSGYEIF